MPISQKVKDLIYNAWVDGAPCLLATAGPKGPNISPKGSMLVYDDAHLAFSNRPFGVKHFQAIHHCSVDVAHGLALLFGIGTRLF